MSKLEERRASLGAGRRSDCSAWPHPSPVAERTARRPELSEEPNFGANPGELRMFAYVPEQLDVSTGAALVVALHGCGQSAASFDHGSGWTTLAQRHGFALLMPEQRFGNNPNNCFTWYLPSDARRGHGEAMSIRQMIEHMIVKLGLDRDRIYITGLSAGGAMTSVMLANYPDVFAGGAIIAGLPFGGARSVSDALQSMSQGRDYSPEQWSDHVLTASQHRGTWPKVSVWHGSADSVVHPKNADDILKQWTHLHGVSAEPHAEHEIEGHVRRAWRNHAGEEVIEAFVIDGMGHGVPLALGDADTGCGRISAYHFDVGISSGTSIARFWGLTGESARVAAGAVGKSSWVLKVREWIEPMHRLVRTGR